MYRVVAGISNFNKSSKEENKYLIKLHLKDI